MEERRNGCVGLKGEMKCVEVKKGGEQMWGDWWGCGGMGGGRVLGG